MSFSINRVNSSIYRINSSSNYSTFDVFFFNFRNDKSSIQLQRRVSKSSQMRFSCSSNIYVIVFTCQTNLSIEIFICFTRYTNNFFSKSSFQVFSYINYRWRVVKIFRKTISISWLRSRFSTKKSLFLHINYKIFLKKIVNLKLISINVQQTIKRVISIYSRSTKFNRDIDDVIDRIKFIEFIESKHVSRWVVNYSRLCRNVRVFVHIVKTTLKKISFIDTITNNSTLTRFSIETKTKAFIRRFNNTSKITIEKNIYNQLFEFHFDNDENIIINQLNVQNQRIVNVVIDNYIVKYFSQFDLSNSSKFSNSSNF